MDAFLVRSSACLCFVLVLVLLSLLQSTTARQPEETSFGRGCYAEQIINETITIVWESSVMEDSINYYSNPLCIDENGWYVLRVCANGSFVDEHDEPHCAFLQDHYYSCMDNLQLYHNEKQGVAFCYTVSEQPMTYAEHRQQQCPYKQVDAFSNWHLSLCDMFPAWLPYHREYNSTIVLNRFVPDAFPISALRGWEGDWEQGDNLLDGCLSCAQRYILSTDCNVRRHHVCTYRAIPLNLKEELYAAASEATFCEQVQPPGCRIAWDVDSIKCACPRRIDQCYVPAVYPTATRECVVGLEKTPQGALIWTSSKQPVRNTFWSVSRLSTTRWKHVVYTDSGWVAMDNLEDVNCILCELHFQIFTPQIEVEDALKPSLSIKEPLGMFNGLSDDETSYEEMCFMDGGSTRFKDLREPGLWQCGILDLANTSRRILSKPVEITFGNFVFHLQCTSSNMKHLLLFASEFLHSENYYCNHLDEDIVCRLSVPVQGTETHEAYIRLREAASLLPFDAQVFNYEYCHAFKVTQGNHLLRWPKALAGEESQSACYDADLQRMRIRCVGNITVGSRFTAVPTCVYFRNNRSDEIADLEHAEEPPAEILANLTTILEEEYEFTAQDYSTTANIIEKLSEEAVVDDVIKVVSTMMTQNAVVLQESQEKDYVTDRVLSSLDGALRATVINASEEIRPGDNVECVFMDAEFSEFTGAAYLKSGNVSLLQGGLTLDDILGIEDLQYAVYIVHNGGNGSGYASIAMFKSLGLFNEVKKPQEVDYYAYNKVFGVLLPEPAEAEAETAESANVEVMLVFQRAHSEGSEVKCAYWRYGDQQHGGWQVQDDNATDSFSTDDFLVCVYNHTTHFGQLIMQAPLLDPIGDQILSMMTAIECALSTLGLCAILITGVIFPHWRERNHTLLHYCVVLLVQTVLLFVNTNVRMVSTPCIVAGALLHFTILSQFCWMFTIAVHKYHNFVSVFQTAPLFFASNWVMLFTYGAPTIIIGAALGVDRHAYDQDSHLNICYPRGMILIYMLLLPTAAIATVNACIFTRIIFSLFANSRVKVNLVSNWFVRNVDKLRALGVMLFTLGITWWLGYAATLLQSGFLLYMFSIATALQGFILFLFNVLTNKRIQAMYTRRYRVWSLKTSDA